MTSALNYSKLSQEDSCVVDAATLRQRVNRGWPLIEAQRTPPGTYRNYSDRPAPPVEKPVPSRVDGNFSMPPGSLVLKPWPTVSNVNRRV